MEVGCRSWHTTNGSPHVDKNALSHTFQEDGNHESNHLTFQAGKVKLGGQSRQGWGTSTVGAGRVWGVRLRAQSWLGRGCAPVTVQPAASLLPAPPARCLPHPHAD